MLRAGAKNCCFARADAGIAFYWRWDSDSRVSYRLSEQALQCVHDIHERLFQEISRNELITTELAGAISHATHNLERLATRQGHDKLAKQVATFRRLHNFPRYDGGLAHKVGCLLFGLKCKELVSMRLRKMFV